jgi:hypothetical protein
MPRGKALPIPHFGCEFLAVPSHLILPLRGPQKNEREKIKSKKMKKGNKDNKNRNVTK